MTIANNNKSMNLRIGKQADSRQPQEGRQEPVITEEDRNSDPIFRTIYKRIRNLNKKLGHIEALEALDPVTLKPEQLSKLASRPEVESEVRRNE